jgi:hypothetical protein
MLSFRFLGVASLLLLALGACSPGQPFGGPAAVAEVKHAGYRQDIPDARARLARAASSNRARNGALL